MNITYLGHAGFIVETDQCVVIMDPWLSRGGAFDSAWFQFPRNQHLAPLVHEKLKDRERKIFLYVSHEHQDHLDVEFLSSLPDRNFTLLMPEFSRTALMKHFSDYECNEVIFFRHKQRISIPDGSLTLYVDDSQLNRDSAVLVRAGSDAFLNMNDCKLFDSLPELVREEGRIQVFACQFSGATWHPTCYDYPPARYEAISQRKSHAKFETVAQAIDLIGPDAFIPSAGPVCFLDPELLHLTLQPVNIFPRASKVIEFLKHRLHKRETLVPELMPGDVLATSPCRVVTHATQRFHEDSAFAYITEYADSYQEYFRDRTLAHDLVDPVATMASLRRELEHKLSKLSLADRVTVPLYFYSNEAPHLMLRVDFKDRVVEYVEYIRDTSYFEIVAPAWQIESVLTRSLTWEEFSLTFRMRLKREPDTYDPILHAFLIMESEDLEGYCNLIVQIEAQEERIVVNSADKSYSVRRYCPHQGADLSCGSVVEGKFLTCPRHRWQFDLLSGGQCTSNNTSIKAVPLVSEEDKADKAGSLPVAR